MFVEKVSVRESVSGGRVAWGSLVLGTPKSSFCCECDLPLVLSLLPRGRVAAGLVTFSLFLVLEMRNFGNRGFLLRQLAKSQSRKLPPEVTPPDHARNFHFANFTILYQARTTAQVLWEVGPVAMER